MNKRIEELTETCYSFDHLSFDHKKFAALIVKECASYIEDRFCLDGEEIYVANKLKEHFGVEE